MNWSRLVCGQKSSCFFHSVYFIFIVTGCLLEQLPTVHKDNLHQILHVNKHYIGTFTKHLAKLETSFTSDGSLIQVMFTVLAMAPVDTSYILF